MNILEGILQNTKHPEPFLHAGEAFFVWRYFLAVQESRMLCLLMLNHTDDYETKELLEHFINEIEEPQAETLSKLMKDEGIPFPTTTLDKPKANEAEVPAGAKFTDAEIAAMVTLKLEGLLALAQLSMIQCTRDEVGMMFFRFHGQLMSQAFSLKKLMQKRGWLMVPPRYGAGSKVAPH